MQLKTEKPILERYSRICDPCAKQHGGECTKQIVCFNIQECDICGVESECLSGKDYRLPLHGQVVYLKEKE